MKMKRWTSTCFSFRQQVRHQSCFCRRTPTSFKPSLASVSQFRGTPTLFWNASRGFAKERDVDFNKDYYKLVGVKKDASARDLRTGYFKAAKKYHPDVTQHLSGKKQELAKQKFIAISHAYDILSDSKLRVIYDERRSGKGTIDPKQFRESFERTGQRYQNAGTKGADLRVEFRSKLSETEEVTFQWWNQKGAMSSNNARKRWRQQVKKHRGYDQHSASSLSEMQQLLETNTMKKMLLKAKRRYAFQQMAVWTVILLVFGYVTKEVFFTTFGDTHEQQVAGEQMQRIKAAKRKALEQKQKRKDGFAVPSIVTGTYKSQSVTDDWALPPTYTRAAQMDTPKRILVCAEEEFLSKMSVPSTNTVPVPVPSVQ